jgi:hypothetical protein
MVIPRAMGPADELLAWVLRGWVEAGIPDLTLGGAVPESGGFSAENIPTNAGVDGLLLTFSGFDPGEEWVYVVVATGRSVQVACGDTLFSHAYAGIPPAELGARILVDVRAHNAAFHTWRGQGGVVGLSESRSIRVPRGDGGSKGFVDLLERRYSTGRTLEAGPAEGWWLPAHTAIALGGAIRKGEGVDPTFRLGAAEVLAQSPEERALALRVERLGMGLMVAAVLGALVGGLGLAFAGFNVFRQRADVILVAGLDGAADLLSSSAFPLVAFLGAMVFSGSLFTAGLRMRAKRNLTLVRVLLVISAIPCSGACCFAGLPLSAWALYVLQSPHAGAVFGQRNT